MKPILLAYAAGMVDLEGTIFLAPTNLQPVLQVVMPRHTRAVIDLLKDLFSGQVDTTTQVEWTLDGADCQNALRHMLPHLERLKAQATLVVNMDLDAPDRSQLQRMQALNREFSPIPPTPLKGMRLLALRVGDNWALPQADLFSETGLEPLSGSWPELVMTEASAAWTANGSDWPSADEGSSVCSLASILEKDVPAKYFLSRRACAGILRRAEERGKTLPVHLRRALEEVASMTPTQDG